MACWILTHYSAWGTSGTPLSTYPVAAAQKATNLIVVVHHYTGAMESMADVRRAIQEARPRSDILMVEYPATYFSNADCFQISEQICQKVNEIWNTNSYSGVEFVGYSMGALLARKAYVYGWGRIEDLNPDPDAPATTRPPQPWVSNTSRFVLLAGMNRGWTTRTRPNGMGVGQWLTYRTGKIIGFLTGTGRLIRQSEAGEPFVANLRMQWLDVYRTAKDSFPLVVQLLGDKDNLVTREDERDLSVSKDFVWVQLTGTGHGNAATFEIEESELDEGQRLSLRYAEQRRHKFVQALGDESAVNELRRASPRAPSAEDTNVVAGVVVLHGIRDLGAEWTSQFEDALHREFAKNRPSDQKLVIYRPTYGYFDMISFLQWPERQAKVRWFMDELTELQSKYPNMTNLSFIGHSHGTYVLGSALMKYKALKLDRAVLAGSVLPQRFAWRSPSLTNRIHGVRNYVGSHDLVVAWFPRLFELLHGDLGSAGFNGFRKPDQIPNGTWRNFMKETTYVRGAHSAAIQPGDTNMIHSIVKFVIDGEAIEPARRTDAPAWWIRLGSHPLACLMIWAFLVLFLGMAGVYATWSLRRLTPHVTRVSAMFRKSPSLLGILTWGIYIFFIWNLLQLL